ncbi:hypothetical protein [Psychrobacter sp. I-STPA10]|uniref:hypothetical protein n=1 Tax=Psychrobacter sp. I-STPA10 TaxID=2585769 RepID=UPI001E315E10|nr:hypothetical protein [Psychrobacter sp. I-STPA10]
MKPKSLRRHHLQRLKHKRKYDRNYHSHLTYTTTGETAQIVPIHQHIITPARCSCWMCGNPRKFYGNSKHAKTIQERRADNDCDYWQQYCL